MDQNQLLTRQQAAEYLQVTPQTLAVWQCERRYSLPCVKVGRCARYRRCDLDAWLDARTDNRAEPATEATACG